MNDTLPADAYSRRRRELNENPGALAATSTISVADFYGNLSTYVVETFRVDGQETVFLAITDHLGGRRSMLPPEITAAIYRQRDQLVARSRVRAARQGVETRRARGDAIGNPDALRRARKARGKGKGK